MYAAVWLSPQSRWRMLTPLQKMPLFLWYQPFSFSSSAFSFSPRMSYKWNPTVCSLVSHFRQWFSDLSIFRVDQEFIQFYQPSGLPLYGYTTICLFVHLLMYIAVVYIFLLRIKLCQHLCGTFLRKHMFPFCLEMSCICLICWVKYAQENILGCTCWAYVAFYKKWPVFQRDCIFFFFFLMFEVWFSFS